MIKRRKELEEKIALQEIALDSMCVSLNEARQEIARLKDELADRRKPPHDPGYYGAPGCQDK